MKEKPVLVITIQGNCSEGLLEFTEDLAAYLGEKGHPVSITKDTEWPEPFDGFSSEELVLIHYQGKIPHD